MVVLSDAERIVMISQWLNSCMGTGTATYEEWLAKHGASSKDLLREVTFHSDEDYCLFVLKYMGSV